MCINRFTVEKRCGNQELLHMFLQKLSTKWLWNYVFLLQIITPFTAVAQEQDEIITNDAQEEGSFDINAQNYTIHAIIIEGNKHIPIEPIKNRIPFQVGDPFSRNKTGKLIRNVYDLGYFRQVEVFVEHYDESSVDLIVVVQEKSMLEGVEFIGNKRLAEKEIAKKIDFTKIPAVDADDLPKYIKILKKLYREKDYHHAQVDAQLIGDDDHTRLKFTIQEGKQTLIKRVKFKGNNHFRGKKLRSLIFTREDWVFGFLDRSGSYQPGAIDADKHAIEDFYQSNGFFNAKITDVAVDTDAQDQTVDVTFQVEEGEQYTISSIRVPGNDVINEDKLLEQLPIKVGQLYSKEKVRDTIEALRNLWGDLGYINADVEPSLQPNDDDKTIAISFYTELGAQVYVNSITICGNYKTHDKVIRRKILPFVQDGCLLTAKALEESRVSVESLGYFDPKGGVNWRIHKIDATHVDLELILKEVKTGRAEAQIGFGGSQQDIASPMESLSVGLSVRETNLFGRGIHLNASSSIAKEERNLLFNITNPWLFDRPIHSAADLYFKRSIYDEFTMIKQNEISERITGGATNIGFLSKKLYDSTISLKTGVDGITYGETPIVKTIGLTPSEVIELQNIFDKRFASGAFLWVSGIAFKDTRNHPVHPSRGYQYLLQTKFTIHSNLKDNPKDSPAVVLATEKEKTKFGYGRLDLDVSWYTPLIGERDLVMCLHGYFGIAAPFKNRSVPFRELFHAGGPTSVRGFLFGEIGPMYFAPGTGKKDMLGATKAFWLNAELIFPITGDFAMKGVFFYDGGAGWSTPDAHTISPGHLVNNSFSFRHSVGIGFRILRPTPVKIDWGFKLDRKKGESASEVHFSMYQDF